MSNLKKYYLDGIIDDIQIQVLQKFSMFYSSERYNSCFYTDLGNLTYSGSYESIIRKKDNFGSMGKYINCFHDSSNNSMIEVCDKNLYKILSFISLYDFLKIKNNIIYSRKLAISRIDEILHSTKNINLHDCNEIMQKLLDLQYKNDIWFEPIINLLYYGFGTNRFMFNKLKVMQNGVNNRINYDKALKEDDNLLINIFSLQTMDLSILPKQLQNKIKSYFKYKTKTGYFTQPMIESINRIGAMDIKKINSLIDIIDNLPHEKFIRFNDFHELALYSNIKEAYSEYGLTEKQIISLEKIYNRHKKYFESKGLIFKQNE